MQIVFGWMAVVIWAASAEAWAISGHPALVACSVICVVFQTVAVTYQMAAKVVKDSRPQDGH